MKYKNNLDILNNGTQDEKKIILESFMYWIQNYNPHPGLVQEWLDRKPKVNFQGDIIVG